MAKKAPKRTPATKAKAHSASARTQQTHAAGTLPRTPATWPGAFGAYKYSKQAVMVNIGTLIIIWLLTIIFNGGERIQPAAGGIVGGLVGALATVCYVLVYLAGVRNKEMSLGEALQKALPLWWKMILLGILVAVSLAASLLLLVVPFFFVLPRLSLSHYFLVDKNMGVVEAYKASWAATQGHVGTIWGIIGAFVAMVLLMITVIGIPFSIYFLVMYSGVFAVLYEFLNKANPAR